MPQGPRFDYPPKVIPRLIIAGCVKGMRTTKQLQKHVRFYQALEFIDFLLTAGDGTRRLLNLARLRDIWTGIWIISTFPPLLASDEASFMSGGIHEVSGDGIRKAAWC